MIKLISIILVRGTKPESTANWESLYVGLKQEGDFISGNTDFSFESEEVTGSLFNEEEVEQTVNNAYQIHKKYIVSPIKSGMVIVSSNIKVLYEQF
jgi:DNA mismatch repair protein MutL